MKSHIQTLSFSPRSGFSNTTSSGLIHLSPISETFAGVLVLTTTDVLASLSTVTFSSSSSHVPVLATAQASFAKDASIVAYRSSAPAPSALPSSESSILSSASSFPTSTAPPDGGPPQPGKPSPSTAIGIGVGVGLLSLILLTAVSLFFYQKWHDRTRRGSLHCRRARLWKGFTPAPHVYTDYGKSMEDGYTKRLVEPPTPSPALSSPFSERHARWSWQSPYMNSPMLTPLSSNTAFELPARTSRVLIV